MMLHERLSFPKFPKTRRILICDAEWKTIERRYTSVTVRTIPMSMHFWAMSCQSMNWMAPLGHCSAQRPQLMHFVEVRLSVSMRGMFHGQACAHMPQPMQRSLSTMRAPFSSLT